MAKRLDEIDSTTSKFPYHPGSYSSITRNAFLSTPNLTTPSNTNFNPLGIRTLGAESANRKSTGIIETLEERFFTHLTYSVLSVLHTATIAPITSISKHRIQVAEARSAYIRSLQAPNAPDEFFARAAETLSDLRQLVKTYPRLATAEHLQQFDKIDEAMRLLSEEAASRGKGGGGPSGGGSGGGGGGGDGGDGSTGRFNLEYTEAAAEEGKRSWMRRMGEALTAFAKKLSDLAGRIARAISSGAKSLWTPTKLAISAFIGGVSGDPRREAQAESGIARAWYTFWHVAGKVAVAIVPTLLGAGG